MIGVKVFGDESDQSKASAKQVAAVLRQVPGAVDVFPDQSVGKGYLEITIDRQKAARYGVNVGDIQDVIEVALGGKDDHHDGGRPRALSRPHPLRPGLARRRGEREEPAGQRFRGRQRTWAVAMEAWVALASRQCDGSTGSARATPGRCKFRWRWSPTCGSSKAPA